MRLYYFLIIFILLFAISYQTRAFAQNLDEGETEKVEPSEETKEPDKSNKTDEWDTEKTKPAKETKEPEDSETI